MFVFWKVKVVLKGKYIYIFIDFLRKCGGLSFVF